MTKPEPPAASAELGDALGGVLGELDQLPKSKLRRVLVRGALVGFLVVFVWIFAIVYLQWRAHRRPDFRGLIETELVQLRAENIRAVYDAASPRFQELVRFETFSDQVQQITQSLGRFRELATITNSETHRSPSGLTAYIKMRLRFDKGLADASMSFHRTGGQWRLLQLTVDLPPEIALRETTNEQRKKRSAAPPEVRAAAERVLGQLRDGQSQAVWDQAAGLFRQSITPRELAEIEREHDRSLGKFVRIIQGDATQTPSGTSATIDALAEYEHATARLSLGFSRSSVDTWELASYQLVLPMPRIQQETQPSDEELLRETAPRP